MQCNVDGCDKEGKILYHYAGTPVCYCKSHELVGRNFLMEIMKMKNGLLHTNKYRRKRNDVNNYKMAKEICAEHGWEIVDVTRRRTNY